MAWINLILLVIILTTIVSYEKGFYKDFKDLQKDIKDIKNILKDDTTSHFQK